MGDNVMALLIKSDHVIICSQKGAGGQKEGINFRLKRCQNRMQSSQEFPVKKVFFEASKILSVNVEYCRLFPAPSLSGKWGRDVWPWWMVVPASSSYRVPPSFLQIPIPLRQRSPPHRHLLMSFLQQSSDPSTVHCTVQHPNKTLFHVHVNAFCKNLLNSPSIQWWRLAWSEGK